LILTLQGISPARRQAAIKLEVKWKMCCTEKTEETQQRVVGVVKKENWLERALKT